MNRRPLTIVLACLPHPIDGPLDLHKMGDSEA